LPKAAAETNKQRKVLCQVGALNEARIELTSRSVAGILRKGGTMLGTPRSDRFMADAG
jgi:6-phosphofructokinase